MKKMSENNENVEKLTVNCFDFDDASIANKIGTRFGNIKYSTYAFSE